ncbi:hypothetical protein BDW71DRAFT_189857 [Aspergillus fruticulosus]
MIVKSLAASPMIILIGAVSNPCQLWWNPSCKHPDAEMTFPSGPTCKHLQLTLATLLTRICAGTGGYRGCNWLDL